MYYSMSCFITFLISLKRGSSFEKSEVTYLMHQSEFRNIWMKI